MRQLMGCQKRQLMGTSTQLGLSVCFRENNLLGNRAGQVKPKKTAIGVVVFGSDQGLVGQFNEVMAEFVAAHLVELQGEKIVWVIGERIHSQLAEIDLGTATAFTLPNSIHAIAPLVGDVLTAIEARRAEGDMEEVHLFYHRPETGASYKPVTERLLPLDQAWQQEMIAIQWPSNNLPEVLADRQSALGAFLREYFFLSLFRACAQSLASENASRLAAMQRAENNIDELQQELQRDFHHLRQSGIDEELFDLISGFEGAG